MTKHKNAGDRLTDQEKPWYTISPSISYEILVMFMGEREEKNVHETERNDSQPIQRERNDAMF